MRINLQNMKVPVLDMISEEIVSGQEVEESVEEGSVISNTPSSQ